MDFDTAFQILVNPQHEGGYVNDPKDPGGETKFGISRRSYPAEDIAGLTLDRAKSLYRHDFWGPAGCDAVPEVMKYDYFDFAVNTSQPGRPVTAIRVLQHAVGAAVDGVIGPQTILMLSSAEPNRLFRRFTAAKIRYYTGTEKHLQDRYLAGWMNRIATNLEAA